MRFGKSVAVAFIYAVILLTYNARAAQTLNIQEPVTGQRVTPGQSLVVRIHASAEAHIVKVFGQCLDPAMAEAKQQGGNEWIWTGKITDHFSNERVCPIFAMGSSTPSDNQQVSQRVVLLPPDPISRVISLITERERSLYACVKETVYVYAQTEGRSERVELTYDPDLIVTPSEPSIVRYLGKGEIMGLYKGDATLTVRYKGSAVTASTLLHIRQNGALNCSNQ